MSAIGAAQVTNNQVNKAFLQRLAMTPLDWDHLSNIGQYVITAIIPIILLDYSVRWLFPPEGHFLQKSTPELIFEVLLNMGTILVGLYCVQRFVVAFGTWSGVPMSEMNYSMLVLAIMVTTLLRKGVVRDKVDVLTGRLIDLWDGRGDSPSRRVVNRGDVRDRVDRRGLVRVTQPLGGRHGEQSDAWRRPPPGRPRGGQGSGGDMALPAITQESQSSLLRENMTTQGAARNSTAAQPTGAQGEVYGGPVTPLVDAKTPSQQEGGGGTPEPMAANEVLGGGAFAKW